MKLYLVQHGDAVSKQDDPARPLSETGKRQVKEVAAFVARAGLRVTTFWHSGKARAAETARILAERVGGDSLEAHAGLNPEDDPSPLFKELKRREDDLAIVGHLPHLSLLAGLLLTGKDSREPVAFQRGGVVALERTDSGQWRLVWALSPALLGAD